uniref:Cleavage and polyadenylation specificity factor subunit 4 n=1 Tax=Bubo bubo TaxID=30461 RepID=A0A8C0FXH9_BUBBB
MQELVAGVEKIRFDLEADVEQQRGARPLPFLGMDELGVAACEFFHQGLCTKGVQCPFPHVGGEKAVVCKHWLRGLCKKGDSCDFLHEYDATKMPECYFHAKFGPLCKYQHTRRVMCTNYLVGFCPEGPKCKFMQYVWGRPRGSSGDGQGPSPRLQGWLWPLKCLGQGQGSLNRRLSLCPQCRQKGHHTSKSGKTQVGILLGK